MEGKRVKVAVIDSGIDCETEAKRHWKIQKKYCLINGEIKETDKCQDYLGHGTAVFSILYNYEYGEYLFFKIFEKSEQISIDSLIIVLQYIYHYVNCDMIHMSCGITGDERISELEQICILLSQKGTIIVSSFDNYGAISYPAAFSCVIGVDMDAKIVNKNLYKFIQGSEVNIRAIGTEQRLPWIDGKHAYVSGSSFAAPYITMKLIQYLYEGGEKGNVDSWLKDHAYKCESVPVREKMKRLKIHNAILFPYNKEIANLARHVSDITFEIYGIYDKIEMGKVGKSVLLNERNVKIQNIEQVQWDSSVDTIIIGHLEYYELFFPGIKERVIQEAMDHNLQIYLFDDKNIENVDICSGNIFVPAVDDTCININSFGKMYDIAKPVVSVLGTSSKQGKLSLQLFLKRMFQSDGYRVGYLGTEPSAFLYGADECYPMGESSAVKVQGSKALQTVNYFMHEIEKEDPDIILTGGQSQTIAYNYGNVGCHTIPQHEFLMGTLPDAIILCVNSFDEISYIDRTICYIESVTEGKVICLMLSPIVRNLKWSVLGNRQYIENGEVISIYKEKLIQNFSIPVYELFDDKEMENCYQTIIKFFTE